MTYLHRKALTCLSVLATVLGLMSCTHYSATGPISARSVSIDEIRSAKVDSILAGMSVREKVAQLFVIALNEGDDEEDFARQDSLVRMGAGALIMMRGPVRPFIERVNGLQERADIPLMVTTDAEWGASMRFPEYQLYPRQWELGHLDNAEKLLYRMGRNVGRELKDLNILVNFAPVVDLAAEEGEITRVQSRLFSTDHHKVASYGLAYMRGMQDEGISACGKHFPGFSGTRVDSHYDLPVSFASKEKIDTVELEPFRQMIAAGLKMVMMGHLSLPSVDSTGTPMSISRNGVTGLLKEHLGFDGLVITDALGMGAVSNHYSPVESNLMAYRAGVDLMLMPMSIFDTITALTDSVQCGTYPMEELDEKVRKVLTLKENAGYFEDGFDPIVSDVERKIKQAGKRDRRLIRQMTRQLKRAGYGEPITDWTDPTLVLNKSSRGI